jgi:hypothetical protein
MAYWYACDVITVTPPASGTKIKEVTGGTYPMLFIDTTETWTVRHNQSGQTRNVTYGGLEVGCPVEAGYAYEEDNAIPEICLVRTEEPIPQAVIDRVNAVAGGGQFVVEIDTIAKRDALYAAYPSLQNRFADQP